MPARGGYGRDFTPPAGVIYYLQSFPELL